MSLPKVIPNNAVLANVILSIVFRTNDVAPLINLRHRLIDNNRLSVEGFRQPYWTLKPLFFEVPNADPMIGGGPENFVGRHWLFREIADHLSSDLPTNRGVIVAGAAGSGKTAVILKLVKHSCFGRGESMYQGKRAKEQVI